MTLQFKKDLKLAKKHGCRIERLRGGIELVGLKILADDFKAEFFICLAGAGV